ncbi:MAG: mraY [Chlamydiales bacterium]|nr:mraY [Chlamydiales bacterium]
MLLSLFTAFFFVWFAMPAFIRRLRKWKLGQFIRTDEAPLLGVLHSQKKETPTMGGLLILAGIFLSLLLWMDLSHSFTWLFALSLLILGSIGAFDDSLKIRHRNAKGLMARRKFLAQCALALSISAYLLNPGLANFAASLGLKVPIAISLSGQESIEPLSHYMQTLSIPFYGEIFFRGLWPSLLLWPLFFTFVIAGSSNAVNLTDGLDGLASGLLIISSLSFALIAFLSEQMELCRALNMPYIQGSGEVAIFLCAFIGALIAFLWYNASPAEVFMGDTGSLALGGLLGLAAVLLKKELLLGLIGFVFVAETLSVILQVASFRLRAKKRIFLCAPLHHHFEYLGWPETKVVVRFWIFGLLLAMLGLASLMCQ